MILVSTKSDSNVESSKELKTLTGLKLELRIGANGKILSGVLPTTMSGFVATKLGLKTGQIADTEIGQV